MTDSGAEAEGRQVRAIHRAAPPATPPYYTIVALASLALATFALHLWHADWRIPFYSALGGDALGTEAALRNLLLHGTFYDNPQLAAPLGAHLEDFPALIWFHELIVRLLNIATGDAMVSLNLYFVIAFPLAALTAFYVLRRIGLTPLASMAPAILFSLLPYRFYRSEAHLFFGTYWIVPLSILACVLVARGTVFMTRDSRGSLRPTRDGWFVFCIAILVGGDNQYNVLFTWVLLAVAAVAAFVRSRDWKPGAAAAAIVLVSGLSLVCAAVPTIVFHAQHGQNGAAYERHPEESEIYALQIAQLVLPVPGHRLPILAQKRATFDASALYQTENTWSSLGMLASVGFIFLLALSAFRSFRTFANLNDDIDTLAAMNLSAVLLATFAGFGALVNFFVRDEIRAYNRISPFIALISFAAIAFLFEVVRRRWVNPQRSTVAWAAVALIAILGTLDQTTAGMIPPYAASANIWNSDETFTRAIEARLAPSSAIFELPSARFPESPPIANLEPQAEYRPLLHSTTLRLSYGAIEGRAPASWLHQTAGAAPAEQIRRLIAAQFDGIIVFRDGYPDHGVAIEKGLAQFGAPVISPLGDMAFYSIRDLRRRAVLKNPELGDPTLPMRLTSVESTFGAGFYGEEHDARHDWHWAMRDAAMNIRNDGSAAETIHITGLAETAQASEIVVTSGTHELARARSGPTDPAFGFDVSVPPGLTALHFSSTAVPLAAPDPRVLVFRLLDVHVAAARTPDLSMVLPELLPLGPVDSTTQGSVAWAGCTAMESGQGTTWHWCSGGATISVSAGAGHYRLRALVQTPGQPVAILTYHDGSVAHRITIRRGGTALDIPITVPSSGTAQVRIETNARPLVVPSDPRTLVMQFMHPTLTH